MNSFKIFSAPLKFIKQIRETLNRQLPEDRLVDDESPSAINFNDLYTLIYPHAKKYWKLALLSLITTALSGLAAWPVPLLFRYLVDNVLIPRVWEDLPWVLALYFCMTGAEKFFRLTMQVVSSRYKNWINLSIKNELVQLTLNYPKAFFDKTGVGYIMDRLTHDVGRLAWFYSQPFFEMIIESLRLIGGVTFLLYLDWRIGLCAAVSLPFYALVLVKFYHGQFALTLQESENQAVTQEELKETLSNITLIKGSAGEQKAVKSLKQKFLRVFRVDLEIAKINSAFTSLIDLLPNLAQILLLVFGSIWVIRGEWTLGSLLASMTFLHYVLGPARILASQSPQIQSARAAARRVQAFYKLTPEENLEAGTKIDHLKGRVDFRNIYFGYYPGQPVLRDLSFTVEPGQVVAIAGASGSGKSTLAALLMGFYQPQKGEILFDERPIRQLNLRSLRSRIAYVNQVSNLFSGSLGDNLAYQAKSVSDEEIIALIESVGADDIIASMSSGLDSQLQEDGKNLSIGQRQRLSVAREMLKRPDIMILDEPTASLDPEHEEIIMRGINKQLANKTVFLISHRKNVVAQADKVLFIKAGRIAAYGSHDELLETCPDYERFFAYQA